MRSEMPSAGLRHRPSPWRDIRILREVGGEDRWVRRWKAGRLLRIGGTLLLGGYLASRIELVTVTALLASAIPVWLAAAVVLYAVDRLVAGIKWRVLFSTSGHRITLASAINLYLQSGFLGAALPTTVGTDLARVHLASRGGGEFAHALSSIVIERFLGVVALLLAAALGLLLLAPQAERVGGIPIFLIVAGIAGVALLVLAAPAGAAARQRIAGVARRGTGLPGRIAGFVLDLLRRLRAYARYPRAIGTALLLAFGQQYLLTIVNWALGLSLGLDLGLRTMLWVWPLVMIAVRLPLSILGFGVRELVLVQLLAETGLAAEQAVALGILSGLLDLAFIGLGGILVLAVPATAPAAAVRPTSPA